MLGMLFHEGVYVPLYNALVGLIDLIPGGDVGVAVILLTLLVKAILFPLALKASRTQVALRELEGPLRDIKERYKDQPEEQAKKTLALYREKGVNPFASIGLLFLQLPVIFGLYWVFYKGGLPVIDVAVLYSFVPTPTEVSMLFFGLIDMAGRSLPLAFLAGATQYLQARYAMPKAPTPKNPDEPTFGEDFARSMHLQMRYVLPVVVGAVAYFATAAVALYWVTSNIAGIAQELYVLRTKKKASESPTQ